MLKSTLLFLSLMILVLILINKPINTEKYYLEDYIVQAGDTAWSIMYKNNDANKDIRELIYYIEKDNDIEAGYLQIGQEIKIRIYERGK